MKNNAISELISFQKVDQTSHEKILEWLQKPHVNEFFHGQGLQNTLNDLQTQVTSGNSIWQHWIASKGEVQFGYLITSEVNPKNDEDDRFAKHMSPCETAITLDLLIGEESHLRHGLAPLMIRTFLQNNFRHINKVFIDPEVANTRAIQAYEKVGFKKIMQFIAEWHPVPHWQMMMEMEHLHNG